MSIISIEIMKTIDEREMQKTTKEKQRHKGAMFPHDLPNDLRLRILGN